MRNETKSYVKYYLKRNLKPFLFILVASLILVLFLGTRDRVDIYQTDGLVVSVSVDVGLVNPAIIAVVVMYFQVTAQLAVFKKRRNLDCYYSLPLSRTSLSVVHSLTGLGITLISYTATYILNIILLMPSVLMHSVELDWLAFLPVYFVTIMQIASCYIVLCFAFDRGNTAGDGRWMMALYSFLPYMLSGTVYYVLRQIFDIKYHSFGNAILPSFVPSVAEIFENVISMKTPSARLWEECVGWTIAWAIIAACAALGFVFLAKRARVERVEEYSDSPFAFKVLIPIYMLCGCLMLGEVLGVIIVSAIALIGYVIYRRGFRLKLCDAITLAVTLVVSIILIAILDSPFVAHIN